MELFISEYGRYVIFFHVISAVIWVGGMIGIRVAVHPALQKISDPKVRIPRVLEVMKRLFGFVLGFTFIIVLTAMLLAIGLGFKYGDPTLYMITHVKEGIWTVMFINLIMMMVKRAKAEKAFYLGDEATLVKNMTMIAKYMIPVNIFLGIVAIYFGIVLRGY